MRRVRLRLSLPMMFGLVIALSPVVAHSQLVLQSGLVSVSGRHLLRDGQLWIPHGFYQIAFEVSPGVPGTLPIWLIASKDYSSDEYTQMRVAGADSVRIQVSQPGMDPLNPLFTPEFRSRVIGAIHAARAAGLTVIISLQDESQTGDSMPTDLPNDATQRVWEELVPAFGGDRGVLFELFNEPRPPPSNPDLQPLPVNWTAWEQAVNKTIQVVRQAGAVNVVVADGLQFGEQLSGAPQLRDPLKQVAYASHPYAHDYADQTPAFWDGKFGDFAQTAPVIITEWGTGYYCDANTPGAVLSFLQYLQAHEIGLEVVAWDWNSAHFGSAVYNFPDSAFSTFVGPSGALSCQDPGFGLGKAVEVWYHTGVPPNSIQ